MIQLRRLQFDAGGSLQPHPLQGPSELEISHPLTRNINTLGVNGFRWMPARAESVREYIAMQSDVLQAIHDLPVPGLDEDHISIQMYGLDTMRERIGAPTSQPLPERFTLSLGPLEPYDIALGDNLNLIAINSWKWVSTLPAAFATPPRWILDSETYRADFDSVVFNMKRRTGTRKLKLNLPKNDWLSRRASDVLARTAHGFQSPDVTSTVFRDHIHPQVSNETETACEERWYNEDRERGVEYNEWTRICQEFHEQLQEDGLESFDLKPVHYEDMFFRHRQAAHGSSLHDA
jgi:hypothetical protein